MAMVRIKLKIIIYCTNAQVLHLLAMLLQIKWTMTFLSGKHCVVFRL